MIGTDSHTVNAGGLGMIAIGVGGADAVETDGEDFGDHQSVSLLSGGQSFRQCIQHQQLGNHCES